MLLETSRVTEEVTPKAGTEPAQESQPVGRFTEKQSAMRFPLRLPVEFHSKKGDQAGETRNISANGVLFQVESEMPVGSSVEFEISMSPEILGAPIDVAVKCRGRVVRSFQEGDQRWAGVVIDEYKFQRR
jgi:hypothetical protein